MFYAIYDARNPRAPILRTNPKTGQQEFAVFATVERAYAEAVKLRIPTTLEVRPISEEDFASCLVTNHALLDDLHLEQLEQM